MNAYDDLKEFLYEGETVEAMVFGSWGEWGAKDPGYVPKDKQGVILTLEEAMPYMEGWVFDDEEYYDPERYATHIWTDQRVIWVSYYDGSTQLKGLPRNPEAYAPQFP